MRAKPSGLLAGILLLAWLTAYVLNVIVGWMNGFSTVFLPCSLLGLIFCRMASRRMPYDLSIIFLLSIFFFFALGIVLWPLATFAPTEFASLVSRSFKIEDLDWAAALLGISVSITILAYSFHSRQPVRDCVLTTPSYRTHHYTLYRIGIVLMSIALPAVAYESWQQFRYIQEAGYLALYVDGVESSGIARLFFYPFYLGFGLALTFASTRSRFVLPASLYLLVATLDSLKGARGAVLVPLLFVAWYYCYRFDITVGSKTLVRGLLLLVSIFMALTYFRDSELLDSGVLQFLVDALASQSRSLQLTALYREFANEVSLFGNYMIFSNLTIPITAFLHPEIRDAAQSIDQVTYSNNLKHIFTYVMNDDYYFSGGGTGGIYLVELIEAGPFFFALFSWLLGWFFAWVPTGMKKPWVRYLSVYFFSTVFYLPRGEFFFNVLIVGKALILYWVVVSTHELALRYARASQPARDAKFV